MEVIPPQAVWEKLSLNIDEINADNAVSKKLLDAELIPPAQAWEKINSTINVVEDKQPQKKETVINLRRLAAAAIFIGIIITAWILIRSNNQTSSGLAGTQDNPVNKNSSVDTNSPEKKNDIREPITIPADPTGKASITSASIPPQTTKTRKNNYFNKHRNNFIPQSTVQYAALNAPLGKSFDQPIDDLSSVTADQHYMTMVNSNGRLVKIPAELAHLAPHMQDKPISEDIYEVMFGEGTYWKETMSEWKKKIASLPVSSGDAFTSFIELLKTVQDK
jgi:hypothetical protein